MHRINKIKANKTISKILVFALIMSVSFVSNIYNTSDVTAVESGIYEYEILEDNTINLYLILNSNSKEIVVPSEIDGYTVTEISGTAIANCKNMTSLVLPSTLKEMSAYATSYASLTEISIDGESEYLTVVDNILYSKDMTRLIYCPPSVSLESTTFTVPDKVTEICNNAFRLNQTLTDIILSDNVISVGNYAFTSSKLSNISIGDNLAEIGTNAFYATTNLNSIAVSDKNQSFTLIDDVLYTSDLTRLIKYPVSKEETDFVIQSTVTTIDNAAFYYNVYLENADLTCEATSIGSYAFFDCTSLKSVTFPVGITEISSRAFYLCTALETIDIPEGVTKIGASAFSGTSKLLIIYLPASLEEIATDGMFTKGATILVYEGTYAEEWVSSFVSSKNYVLRYREGADETPIPTPMATPTATPDPTATPTPTPTVTPEPTPTPNNVWRLNYAANYATVMAPATSFGETYYLLVGKYSDDKLVDFDCVEFEVTGYSYFPVYYSHTMTYDEDGDIKLMIWDSLESLNPVCEATEKNYYNVAAFPGAEGGGKYVTGARNADSKTRTVYHVTNLNNKGTGSFRDAVSQSNRIIVFDVGGEIKLEGALKMSAHLTILGQTAPGDGITITGANVVPSSDTIIRYLRIRCGTANALECDAFGSNSPRIIVDHCSASYSVDECLTFYGSYDVTVQNCISSESLKNSIHSKGAHGYGGIAGGNNNSFYHNLMATHDSRTPRLDRGIVGTDVRNNIIYNWGKTNSAYGAESSDSDENYCGTSQVNWVNNYYKQGPATASGLYTRIFDISSTETYPSDMYFSGNYVTGYEDVSADNTLGIRIDSSKNKGVNFLESEVEMENPLPEETAEETYETLLSHVGATLPKRDETDARIVNDVINGTGTLIDSVEEVGGLTLAEETHRVFEIPDEWKEANGMGDADEADIIRTGENKGYTWIEAYVNEWTEAQENPTNPDVVITSLAIPSLNDTVSGISVIKGDNTTVSGDITVSAIAIPKDGTAISEMRVYVDDEYVTSVENVNEINEIITASTGTHYISVVAINDKGEKTRSTPACVIVN